MKKILLFLFISSTVYLVADSYITQFMNETFENLDNWTVGGEENGSSWELQNHDSAGGIAPQLQIDWDPAVVGLQYITTESINTTGNTKLLLSFNHFLDDYSGNNNSYTIGVQTSSDSLTWHTIWDSLASETIYSETRELETSNDDVGSTTFYLRFFFDGNTYDVDSWAIDNVQLSSISEITGTWSSLNSPYYIDMDITIPIDSTLTIEPDVEVIFTGPHQLSVYGNLLAEGDWGQFITFTAQNTLEGWRGLRFYEQDISGQAASKLNKCTFEYSHATGTDWDQYGGAVYFQNSSDVEIHYSYFRNNVADKHGGAIYARQSDLQLVNCHVENNQAEQGGGISIVNSNFNIINTDIENNLATICGGGISITQLSELNLLYSVLNRNNGTSYGGAISADHSSVNIDRSNIINCNAGTYGGLVGQNTSDLIVQNSIVWNNSDNLLFFDGTKDISYSLWEGGSGESWFTENCIDADPLFEDNANDIFLPRWDSFPIFDETRSPCIDAGNPNSSFDIDNTICDIGRHYFDQGPHVPPGAVSGVWTSAQSPYLIGGNIFIEEDTTLEIEPDVEVIFCGPYGLTVYGNLLAEGNWGELITFTCQDTDYGWAGIHFLDQAFTSQPDSKLNHCRLEHAKSSSTERNEDGSALYLRMIDNLEINYSYFENNSATGDGGAIYCQQFSGTILNCNFRDNYAEKGGALGISNSNINILNTNVEYNEASVAGGALYGINSVINIDYTVINQNVATSYCGAILGTNCEIEIDHTNVINCTSNVYGGMMGQSGSNLTMINSIVWNNSDTSFFFDGNMNIDYSLVEGGTAESWFNDSCIDDDPLFGDNENDNFDLRWDNFPLFDETRSPCIDAGDPFSPFDIDNTYTDLGRNYYDQGNYYPPGNVSGTWTLAESPYYIGGDITVADETTLIIEQGVEVYFGGRFDFSVLGSLIVNGTESSPVIIDSRDPIHGWNGFYVQGSADADSIIIEHSVLKNARSGSKKSNHGGLFWLNNGNHLKIENSTIENCSAEGSGGVFYAYLSDFTIKNCLITQNSSMQNGGCIAIYNSNPTVVNCTFTANSANWNGQAMYSGASSFPEIQNCIFWANSGTDIVAAELFEITYSDIENGTGETWFGEGCIDSNPLFKNELNSDYSITADSPCIDAGNPSILDIDTTISDMGAFYFDQSYPIITSISDVPEDQGHQVQLIWSNSSLNSTYSPYTFYTIWRKDDNLSGKENLYSSMKELLFHWKESSKKSLYWDRSGEVWSFIDQVAALPNHAEYAYVSPTLQDSSTVNCGITDFMIVFHGLTNYYESEIVSGYSIDNIAPDETRAYIAKNRSNYQLCWETVETGTVHGNSYPELNGVWYKVYSGNTPDFLCDESNLIGIVTECTYQIQSDENRQFYKIVVTDTP